MSNPVSRWIDNVYKASTKSGEASGIQNSSQAISKPSEKAKSKEASDARGQLLGALLQNRSYDEQGKIKGSQPDHHVTDSKNHTKVIKSYNDNAPLSDSEKKSLSKAADKIVTESKKKAKAAVDKANAPKTNWITKL